MYCSTCATPLAPGLSYCNRCGASLKERDDSKTGTVNAYLTAISIIAVAGIALTLGGAIALKNGAELPEQLIGIFMLMTFLIVCIVEIFLCRQLSRLTSIKENVNFVALQHPAMPTELRGPQPRSLGEPAPSVTENTTRTLEYSRNEPTR